MSGCTLTHSSINGGTAVTLNCNGVSFGWKNLVSKDSSEGEYDIVPVSFGGFENPIMTLQGTVDVNNIGTNELDQELLIEFATLKSTTPVSLSITCGTNSYALKGRPTDGYETDGSNSLSSNISVFIDDFSIVPDFGSDQGHIWNYTINLTETT